MQLKRVTVVIPIHLEQPNELEKISLAQTLEMLKDYPITFMAPYELDVVWYLDFCMGKAEVIVERFAWRGYEAYSVLMASALFYRRFLDYEYILICHLDAFVFKDELEFWCSYGYDFIGSVIYNTGMQVPNTMVRKVSGYTRPSYFANGGFALKKVSSYYKITNEHRVYIWLYHLVRRIRNRPFYDDLFYAQHFDHLSRDFKMAPLADAQLFGAAFENYDENLLPFVNLYTDSMPFGVHGWIQHNRAYWLPSIRRFGYDV